MVPVTRAVSRVISEPLNQAACNMEEGTASRQPIKTINPPTMNSLVTRETIGSGPNSNWYPSMMPTSA